MIRHTGMVAGVGLGLALAMPTGAVAQTSTHTAADQANLPGGYVAAKPPLAPRPAPPAAQEPVANPDNAAAAAGAGGAGGAQATGAVAGVQQYNVQLQQPAGRAEGGAQRRIDRQREQFERDIRLMMARYGFATDDTQTALIDYIAAEEEARKPLRQTAIRLVRALNQPNIPDDKMRSVLVRYRSLLDTDRMRREKAQAALDARINYSQNPRLESMLLLFGVIGDGKFMIVPAPPPPPVAIPVTENRLANGGPELPAGRTGGRGGFGGGLQQADTLGERAGALAPRPLSAALAPASQSEAALAGANATANGPTGVTTLREAVMADPFGQSLYGELLKRFDANGNHQLEPEERAQALGFLKTLLDTKGKSQVIVMADSNTTGTDGGVEMTRTMASINPKK